MWSTTTTKDNRRFRRPFLQASLELGWSPASPSDIDLPPVKCEDLHLPDPLEDSQWKRPVTNSSSRPCTNSTSRTMLRPFASLSPIGPEVLKRIHPQADSSSRLRDSIASCKIERLGVAKQLVKFTSKRSYLEITSTEKHLLYQWLCRTFPDHRFKISDLVMSAHMHEGERSAQEIRPETAPEMSITASENSRRYHVSSRDGWQILYFPTLKC